MKNVDCALTRLLGLFRVVLCAHVWVYDFPFVGMNWSVVWHDFGMASVRKQRETLQVSPKRGYLV